MLLRFLVTQSFTTGITPPLHGTFTLRKSRSTAFTSHASSFQTACSPTNCQNLLTLEEEISGLERLQRYPSTDFLIEILQRCRKEKALTSAKRLHVYLQRKNLHGHRALGNYLVSTLADCGCLHEAQHVFDSLPEKNAYSYNALILAYSNCGDPERALLLRQNMQASRVQPTTYTYVALLKACSIQQDLELGRQLQEEIAEKALHKDPFVGNALVGMFSKCGSLREAREAFGKLCMRDVVSWSALMGGYSVHGDHDKVLEGFAQMQKQGVSPNVITILCALKSCGILKAIDIGCKVYCEAVKMGFENDLHLGNTLIDTFCKCGGLVEAKWIFDKLSRHDIVSWNVLIGGYVEHGLGKEALSLFNRMLLCNLPLDDVAFLCGLRACASTGAFRIGQCLHSEIVKRGMEGDSQLGNTLVDMLGKCTLLGDARSVFDKLSSRNVVSWSAMIMCYTQHGFDDEALQCFQQMESQGLLLDPIVFTCSLNACCSLGAVERGQVVHDGVIKYGFEEDIHTGTTLVDMYGEFGLLAEARAVFDQLPVRNLLSWSALIKGYGINHEGHMALLCFQEMQEEGVKPDAIAYTSLLVACSHTSLVSEGKDHFHLMEGEAESQNQTIYHFACVLDLLARAGHLSEAARVLDAMQCSPSKEMWKALLSACKSYGEVEMGLKCLKHLTQIDADDASAYTMMIDLYNSSGRFADAENLEKSRKLRSLVKASDSNQSLNAAE